MINIFFDNKWNLSFFKNLVISNIKNINFVDISDFDTDCIEQNEYYIGSSDSDNEFQDAPWNHEANTIMQNIQEAVLVTTYGSGFTMHDVHNDVHLELEAIAYWRAKEVAEDLSLLLSKEFIGLG